MTKISASILSADFSALIRDVNDIKNGGADYLHLDVMDGVFVPNLTFGTPVIASLRRVCGMTFDTHLMIEKPHRYVGQFCDAGSDIVTFHVEADTHENIFAAIETIKSRGKRVGLSIKPKTPVDALLPYINLLDLVLVMTVEPGFGGQSFMGETLEKVRELRKIIDARGLDCELETDGGIDTETAPKCRKAGANVLVAGSAIVGASDRAAAIKAIRGE